jgi:hypothetical protein
MNRNWVLLGLMLIVLVFFVGNVVFWSDYLYGDHPVAVSLQNDTGSVRFLLDVSRINKVLGFRVYSITKEEEVWHVAPLDQDQTNLVFGASPARAQFVFPAKGERPRKLLNGEELCLEMEVQYDVPFSACGDVRYYRFTYLEDEKVIPCTSIPAKSIPAVVKRLIASGALKKS